MMPNPKYQVEPIFGTPPKGMSEDSQYMKQQLSSLQEAGVRPPMPWQGGGLGQRSSIFELLRLLTEAGAMQQQGVQAPAAPGQQQTGTVGGSRNLLQELLGGMHE